MFWSHPTEANPHSSKTSSPSQYGQTVLTQMRLTGSSHKYVFLSGGISTSLQDGIAITVSLWEFLPNNRRHLANLMCLMVMAMFQTLLHDLHRRVKSRLFYFLKWPQLSSGDRLQCWIGTRISKGKSVPKLLTDPMGLQLDGRH